MLRVASKFFFRLYSGFKRIILSLGSLSTGFENKFQSQSEKASTGFEKIIQSLKMLFLDTKFFFSDWEGSKKLFSHYEGFFQLRRFFQSLGTVLLALKKLFSDWKCFFWFQKCYSVTEVASFGFEKDIQSLGRLLLPLKK